VLVRLRGQPEKWVVFIELSQFAKDLLYVQAVSEVQAWVHQSAEKAGVPWEDASQELDSLRKNRFGLLMLHASMKLPDDTTKEAFPLTTLEQKLGAEMYKSLVAKLVEFEQGLDPDNLTAEDIEAFVEDVKKNELGPAELWGFYGTPTVLASLLFLVSQQETSQTERSSDGGSNETSA
jgi:hypothetical protein